MQFETDQYKYRYFSIDLFIYSNLTAYKKLSKLKLNGITTLFPDVSFIRYHQRKPSPRRGFFGLVLVISTSKRYDSLRSTSWIFVPKLKLKGTTTLLLNVYFVRDHLRKPSPKRRFFGLVLVISTSKRYATSKALRSTSGIFVPKLKLNGITTLLIVSYVWERQRRPSPRRRLFRLVLVISMLKRYDCLCSTSGIFVPKLKLNGTATLLHVVYYVWDMILKLFVSIYDFLHSTMYILKISKSFILEWKFPNFIKVYLWFLYRYKSEIL